MFASLNDRIYENDPCPVDEFKNIQNAIRLAARDKFYAVRVDRPSDTVLTLLKNQGFTVYDGPDTLSTTSPAILGPIWLKSKHVCIDWSGATAGPAETMRRRVLDNAANDLKIMSNLKW